MGRCNVLIVDDEMAYLTGLWGLFGDKYTLYTATSAETALEILGREQISVIVTDYQMPGRNGLDLLLEVKSRFSRVVRVLMTAYADMDLVVRALNEGGIHRFIAKPYRVQEFARILGECRDLALIAESRQAPSGGRTVLIAHDSAASQSALRGLLSSSYEVLATANGVEAVNWATTRRVDAVILGIGLAMLDGCSIATYLRGERKLAVPIVFWTGETAGEVGRYLEECGADLVLEEGGPDSLPRLQRFLAGRLR